MTNETNIQDNCYVINAKQLCGSVYTSNSRRWRKKLPGGGRSVDVVGVIQKMKFKLEIKLPCNFVRLVTVTNVMETEFQLLIPTGRGCSMTYKYYHIGPKR